jgi:hypothetical protein
LNRILLYIDSDWNYIDLIISDRDFEILKELHTINFDVEFDITFDDKTLDESLNHENLKYRRDYLLDSLLENGVDKVFIEKSLSLGLPVPDHLYRSNHPFEIDKAWKVSYNREIKISQILNKI